MMPAAFCPPITKSSPNSFFNACENAVTFSSDFAISLLASACETDMPKIASSALLSNVRLLDNLDCTSSAWFSASFVIRFCKPFICACLTIAAVCLFINSIEDAVLIFDKSSLPLNKSYSLFN